jgi:Mg2+/citrate symporter
MQIGIACLVVFLFMALLMYSRRISALLALPIMAFVIAIIGGVPGNQIITDVASKGALKLNATYTTTMFGAILAELMNKQGIARALIRWVAEFAGDNPFILGIVLTLVTALLFSTLGGLGAVIMVGTIVLPVMLSLGFSNVTAGALYLFGISLGGMFNIAGWQMYIDVLKIQPDSIISFVMPFSLIVSSIVVGFLLIELRNRRNTVPAIVSLGVLGTAFWSLRSALSQHTAAGTAAAAPEPLFVNGAGIVLAVFSLYAVWRHYTNARTNPAYAMVSPIIPLVLVLFCKWEFIPAFIAGITFCVLCTWKRDSVNLLTRSIIDGISSVIPAVFLMIGIGMLITSVSNPKVTSAIAPLITNAIPTHAFPYIAVFTVIAPLALYRGPLSLWGMGSGLVKIIQEVSSLTGQAVMAMLMSVGQIQGICDPTNTANIWIATYLGTDTQVLMRKTIPYAWVGVVCGLTLAVWCGYVPR